MAKFYTLDRSGTLIENQNVNLTIINNDSILVEVESLINRGGLISRGNELFPAGMSKHGENYLLNKKLIVNNQHGQPLDFVPTEPIIETIWELIRRFEFPHLPSRMQSLFCWQNLDDLRLFQNKQRISDNIQLNIYEIDTDSYFVGDMNLLYLGGQVLHALELARMYWSGESSSNPHLEVLVPLPVQLGKRVEV